MTKKLLMMGRFIKPASEDKLVAVAQLFHTSGIDQVTSMKSYCCHFMKLATYNLLHHHHHHNYNFLSTDHHLPLCEIEWRSTSTTPLTPDSNQEPAQPEGREHASETRKIQSVFHLNVYWGIAFSRGDKLQELIQ